MSDFKTTDPCPRCSQFHETDSERMECAASYAATKRQISLLSSISCICGNKLNSKNIIDHILCAETAEKKMRELSEENERLEQQVLTDQKAIADLNKEVGVWKELATSRKNELEQLQLDKSGYKAKLSHAQETIKKLKKYAVHKDNCWLQSDKPNWCSCGFTELLNQGGG